MIFKKIIIEY